MNRIKDYLDDEPVIGICSKCQEQSSLMTTLAVVGWALFAATALALMSR